MAADGDGRTTSFTYDFAGRVTGGENADGTTWSLLAEASKGLVDPGSGLGTSTSPAPALRYVNAYAEYTDEQGHDRAVLTDKFGQPRVVEDALLNLFSYTYDSHGRMTSMKLPDPDGAGPLGPLTTTYAYDGLTSNVATITYPDASTESRTYDATFHRPTSHTDPLGRVTLWEIDATFGLVLSETRVVGLLDDELNLETDDVVTSYTYTDGTGGTAALPIGMLLSITDPLGRVTKFAYYTNEEDPQFARLYYRTEAFGTADAGTVFFDYDTRGNVTLFMDELGRETTYQYDMLGRLIAVAYPDPDGAGPLTSPVETYAYDAGLHVTSVTDALGNVTAYTFTDNHALETVTLPDPDGAGPLAAPVYAYTYNDAGQIETETDPLGRVTSYTYDVLNRLETVTLPDPDGAGPLTSPVTTYAYDALGNVSSVTDALGNVTTYEYDNRLRLKKITQADPDGAGPLTSPVTTFTYNAANELLTATDALGRVTTYAYDPLGRVATITLPDPDGGGPLTAPVTTFEYNKLGNQTAIIDALGNRTEYAYDNRNRLTEVTQADPDGGGPLTSPVTTYLYDAAGQLLSITDPLGRVTVYDYDDLGRLVTLTQPDPDGEGDLESPVWTYAYDAVGNLLLATDPLGNETAYAYDNLHRQIQVTQADPDGAGPLTSPVTSYEYDVAGQLLTTIDPLGGETTYEYDDLGRMTKVTQPDPDGAGGQVASYMTYVYDAVGNVTVVTDALNHDYIYTYDNLYRRTQTTDPNGANTYFTFDAVGNLLTLQDPEINITSWAYDNLNRATSETNELADTRYFVYDAAGNLTKKTDRNGRVTEYEYDGLNRRTGELWKSGMSTVRTISYEYDAAGQLLSASDPSAEYEYVYDGLGRATSITATIAGLTPDIIFEQEFDAVGNRLSLSATIDTTLDFLNSYAYDDLHRMTQVTQEDQSGGNAVAEKRVNFAYNALGQFDTITRYANLAGTQHVATSTYAYDDAHRLISLDHARGGTALAGYDFGYDVANRLTSMTNTQYAAESATYDYDDFGQLVGADRTGSGNDEAYDYDDNGNRDTANGDIYTIDTNNRLMSDESFAYDYDAEGNRTYKEDLTTHDYVTYEWDYRNRLTAVNFFASGDDLQKRVEYTYDIFNRWVGKRVDADGDEDFDASEAFVYDGTQIALRFADDSDVPLGASSLANRYLWGPEVDQIMADEQIDWSGSAFLTDELYWLLTDHQNTVRDMATHDPAANFGAGETTIANHIAYDSFGTVQTELNDTHETLVGYTGRPYDEDTGLQNNWHRWYVSANGVWMSEDPIGFAGMDANVVRYVTNSPLTGADPSGLVNLWNPFTWDHNSPNDQTWLGFVNPFESINGDTLGGMWGGASAGTASFWWSFSKPVGWVQGQGDLQYMRDIKDRSFSKASIQGTQTQRDAEYCTDLAAISLHTLLGVKGGQAVAGAVGASASCPARPNIDPTTLQLTQTVANHSAQRPYYNSPHLINQIMSARQPIPDPGGASGALRWDVPGTYNGSMGTWELVIDPATNTILHFLFKGSK